MPRRRLIEIPDPGSKEAQKWLELNIDMLEMTAKGLDTDPEACLLLYASLLSMIVGLRMSVRSMEEGLPRDVMLSIVTGTMTDAVASAMHLLYEKLKEQRWHLVPELVAVPGGKYYLEVFREDEDAEEKV